MSGRNSQMRSAAFSNAFQLRIIQEQQPRTSSDCTYASDQTPMILLSPPSFPQQFPFFEDQDGDGSDDEK